MIYMDNAATTRLASEVLDAMMPFLREEFGNASTLYDLGRRAHAAIDDARGKIARVIHAMPDEIYFTSGGSEADNWAIFGSALGTSRTLKGKHLITSKIEHHAMLNSCMALESQGVEVTYLDVDNEGFVAPEAVRAAIRDNTVLVSVMAANNEIGTIEPLSEIGRIAHERGVLFHTDAVQAFTKEIIDVETMNIDYLSASAHKIHGPKGVGMLYMRHGKSLRPLIHGGSQERGRRAGTENVAGIVGFGKAAELAFENREAWNRQESEICDLLISKLLEIDGCVLNGPRTQRLANNVNVSISGIEGESLVLLLNERGIAAGTGSACASGTSEPSHVLKAIGLSHADAFSGLRLSLSHENTLEEADTVSACVSECVESLRRRNG